MKKPWARFLETNFALYTKATILQQLYLMGSRRIFTLPFRLYWCNECFIFDELRNSLVSSDTYGEIVFEGKVEAESLPPIIVELVLQLKDCTYISKKETIKGKIPSGYDSIRDYVIQARTKDPFKSTYRLENILIEYTID